VENKVFEGEKNELEKPPQVISDSIKGSSELAVTPFRKQSKKKDRVCHAKHIFLLRHLLFSVWEKNFMLSSYPEI